MNVELGPYRSSGSPRRPLLAEATTSSASRGGQRTQDPLPVPSRQRGARPLNDYSSSYFVDNSDLDTDYERRPGAINDAGGAWRRQDHQSQSTSSSRTHNAHTVSDAEREGDSTDDQRRGDLLHRARVRDPSLGDGPAPSGDINGRTGSLVNRWKRLTDEFEDGKTAQRAEVVSEKKFEETRKVSRLKNMERFDDVKRLFGDDGAAAQGRNEAVRETSSTLASSRGETGWEPVNIQLVTATGERRRFNGAISRGGGASSDELGSSQLTRLNNEAKSNVRKETLSHGGHGVTETSNRDGSRVTEASSHGGRSDDETLSETTHYRKSSRVRRPTRKKGLERKTAEFFEDMFEDTFGLFGGGKNRRRARSMQNLSTASDQSIQVRSNLAAANHNQPLGSNNNNSNRVETTKSTYTETSKKRLVDRKILPRVSGSASDGRYERQVIHEERNLGSGRPRGVLTSNNRSTSDRHLDRYHSTDVSRSYNNNNSARLFSSEDERSGPPRELIHRIRPIPSSGQSRQGAFSPPLSPLVRMRNARGAARSYSYDGGLNEMMTSYRRADQPIIARQGGGKHESTDEPGSFASILKIRQPQQQQQRGYGDYDQNAVDGAQHSRQQGLGASVPQALSKGLVTRVVHELPVPHHVTNQRPFSADQSDFRDYYYSQDLEPRARPAASLLTVRPAQQQYRSHADAPRAAPMMTSRWTNAEPMSSAFSNQSLLASEQTNHNVTISDTMEQRPDVTMGRNQVLNFYVFGQQPKPQTHKLQPEIHHQRPLSLDRVDSATSSAEREMREYTIYHKQTQTASAEPPALVRAPPVERHPPQQAPEVRRPAVVDRGRAEVVQTSLVARPQISETRSFEMESNTPTVEAVQQRAAPSYRPQLPPALQPPPPPPDNPPEEEMVVLETSSIEEKEQRIRMEIREDVEFSMLRTQGGVKSPLLLSDGTPRVVEPWWVPDSFEAVVDRRKKKTTKVENKQSDGDFSMRRETLGSSGDMVDDSGVGFDDGDPNNCVGGDLVDVERLEGIAGATRGRQGYQNQSHNAMNYGERQNWDSSQQWKAVGTDQYGSRHEPNNVSFGAPYTRMQSNDSRHLASANASSRQTSVFGDNDVTFEMALKPHKFTGNAATTRRDVRNTNQYGGDVRDSPTNQMALYSGPEVVEETEVALRPFDVENQQVTLSVDGENVGGLPQQVYTYRLNERHLEHVTGSDRHPHHVIRSDLRHHHVTGSEPRTTGRNLDYDTMVTSL